jgi:hypothetical protein
MAAATSYPWHPVMIICPRCEAVQSVAVVWDPEVSLQLNQFKQKVNCASCLEPFEAQFPGRIVRGPLLAVPQKFTE